jgi:hypothetical protein
MKDVKMTRRQFLHPSCPLNHFATDVSTLVGH